ncbi:tetratricopeptide repeat protein [Acinetobacter rathckeae]|uniref:tetratricopeptide repeat protein n=1 Tax=Acinetobacter rathckeae TaxID=2605272 RepID=UPI0018A294C2|nr:tetratricopeptide repeat protein [Acinetobacter rathckeae]MBF7686913.1 tetratricopeptide repeat protein [Acinetobacter rathckeae]
MHIDILNHPILLRKNKDFAKSRQVLFDLINSGELSGAIYLNIAWAYDNEGLEQEALEYYKKALQEKLSLNDTFEATFGLACTYSSLGEYNQAELIFIELHKSYPLATEVIPFYALCLNALHKKDEALQLLFNLIIDHPPTKEIFAYKPAMTQYIRELEC